MQIIAYQALYKELPFIIFSNFQRNTEGKYHSHFIDGETNIQATWITVPEVPTPQTK